MLNELARDQRFDDVAEQGVICSLYREGQHHTLRWRRDRNAFLAAVC